MLARIAWYLLFLIVFLIYFLLNTYLQAKQEKLGKSRVGRFIRNQAQILIGLFPIVVIPWILSGFFSRRFLFFVVAAFEISSLLTYVSYLVFKISPRAGALRANLWWAEFFGIPSQPDPEQIPRLTFKELMRKGKPIVLSLLLLMFLLLGLAAYFVIVSYLYFANPLHSETAVHKLVTLNFGLYLIGAVLGAATNFAQISSSQINDNMRRALFMTQAAYALQIGIIFTVYLGLMGVGGESFLPRSVKLPPPFAQYVPLVPLLLLTAFYLVFLIVPYSFGLAGRRRAQLSLYELVLKRIKTIIDAVGIPGQHDHEQLIQLRDEFREENEAWIENEPMVRDLALKVEQAGATGTLSPNIQKLAEAYRAFKDQDLRYVRLAWAENLKDKFNEMIEEYGRFVGQPTQTEMFIKLGSAYERFFRDEHQEYSQRMKETESRKVIAPVLARLVGVLGAIPVVLQYGQKLIGILPLTR